MHIQLTIHYRLLNKYWSEQFYTGTFRSVGYFNCNSKSLREGTLLQPRPNAFGMRMKLSGNYDLGLNSVHGFD